MSDAARILGDYRARFREAYGFYPSVITSPRDVHQIGALLEQFTAPQLTQAIANYFDSRSQTLIQMRHPLVVFLRSAHQYVPVPTPSGSVCPHDPRCESFAACTRLILAAGRLGRLGLLLVCVWASWACGGSPLTAPAASMLVPVTAAVPAVPPAPLPMAGSYAGTSTALACADGGAGTCEAWLGHVLPVGLMMTESPEGAVTGTLTLHGMVASFTGAVDAQGTLTGTSPGMTQWNTPLLQGVWIGTCRVQQEGAVALLSVALTRA